MEDIKELLINKYPLVKRIDNTSYYELDKKKYLLFIDEVISKNNIPLILNRISEETSNNSFTKWKTIIIVGECNDVFLERELVYFDNTSIVAVFYLINRKFKRAYMNDNFTFALGNNYRKYVKKINKIIVKNGIVRG